MKKAYVTVEIEEPSGRITVGLTVHYDRLEAEHWRRLGPQVVEALQQGVKTSIEAHVEDGKGQTVQ